MDWIDGWKVCLRLIKGQCVYCVAHCRCYHYEIKCKLHHASTVERRGTAHRWMGGMNVNDALFITITMSNASKSIKSSVKSREYFVCKQTETMAFGASTQKNLCKILRGKIDRKISSSASKERQKKKRGPNNTIVSFDSIRTDRKSNAKYSHMLGIEFTFGIAQCFGFRSKFRFLIDFPLWIGWRFTVSIYLTTHIVATIDKISSETIADGITTGTTVATTLIINRRLNKSNRFHFVWTLSFC